MQIEALKDLLAQPKYIVITSHRNPDGDAIGSSLGLYHYLKKGGHHVQVMFPSEFPDFVAFLPDAETIKIHDDDPDGCNLLLEAADIIFCLDYNALHRVDTMGEVIAAQDCTKVLIDHHLEPEAFADFTLSETTASSTSELIYDFVKLMGDEDKLDATIGECLFTGILTDTGSFKYSTSAKLFRTVAELTDLGVDNYTLQDKIFNSLEEKNLRLLGHCLYNRMEILDDYKTGIITLSKKDYEYFDIQRGDTEGIVNYLLKLKNVKCAAFIKQQPNVVKISLRSKGDFSVQEIAQKYFKGGGHRNASGGHTFKGLRKTVEILKEVLPEYKEELNKE